MVDKLPTSTAFLAGFLVAIISISSFKTVPRPRPTTFSKKIACHMRIFSLRFLPRWIAEGDRNVSIWWSKSWPKNMLPSTYQKLFLFFFREGHFYSVCWFCDFGVLPKARTDPNSAYTKVPRRFCNHSEWYLSNLVSSWCCLVSWVLKSDFRTITILTVLSYASQTLLKASSLLCFLPTRTIQLPWSIISQQKTCHMHILQVYLYITLRMIVWYILMPLHNLCTIKKNRFRIESHHSRCFKSNCLRWLLQLWK